MGPNRDSFNFQTPGSQTERALQDYSLSDPVKDEVLGMAVSRARMYHEALDPKRTAQKHLVFVCTCTHSQDTTGLDDLLSHFPCCDWDLLDFGEESNTLCMRVFVCVEASIINIYTVITRIEKQHS